MALTADSKDKLEATAKILDSLTGHTTEEDVSLLATFAAEQLRLT